MNTKTSIIPKHNFINDVAFRFKVFVLVLNRYVKDTFKKSPKFIDHQLLSTAPVISISESDLWNADDNDNNWALTAGKVENLRIASRKLNGIEVKAGEIFSFWKHIDAPFKWNGFVTGREIREGCIVPTIAGGLCQLSNSLYDAALKSRFEIIERHKHTRVVKGSLAELDRDATVKWNYKDLRFRSACDFKIDIAFTPEKLIIQFKGNQKKSDSIVVANFITTPSKLNDCYSCGNVACFKYPGRIEKVKQKAFTTYILDEKWPEYKDYVKVNSAVQDHFIVPFANSNLIKIRRYTWGVNRHMANTFFMKALQRSFVIRRAARSGRNIPSVYLKYDKLIGKKLKGLVPFKSTHIVIAQNLLPFAWKEGILWGRTFDVLMTRLPMEILQQKLDAAYLQHPGSKTLSDFRVDEELMELENIALTQSRYIITPHRAIADIFNNKSIKLDWVSPSGSTPKAITGSKILFPASALGRKGAYEIKRLATELNLDLVVAGKAVEYEGFWEDTRLTFAEHDIFADVKLVVMPAYIEHQPRLLLKALALNIPVVATIACGLAGTDGLHIIPEGDYAALKNTVMGILNACEVLEPVG